MILRRINYRRHAIFLIENELSLRENWDALDGAEDGTFVNLFKYTLDKDQKLRTCNAIIPKHAKYTSPDIQNLVRREIIADVNKSMYLTIFLDGTEDKQRREILSIAPQDT